MKIATWNINSVRLRLDLVLSFLKTTDIDILCLQETKTQNEQFPAAAFADAGWRHQAIRGEKSYNGVAILSRRRLVETGHMEWAGRRDCRHIWARTEDGIGIHNFYVPAGGDVPNPDENLKFAHKLQFLDEMTGHFAANRPQAEILVGDLNIAPLEADVWSSKQLLKVVSHTPVETDGLKRLIADGGWHDAVRAHLGDGEKLYSWWSYRARDWAASDRGRRLDHMWVSHDLAGQVRQAEIHRALRGAEKPSDHVPISLEITLNG
jgi:exodeoxyribonuclease-3